MYSCYLYNVIDITDWLIHSLTHSYSRLTPSVSQCDTTSINYVMATYGLIIKPLNMEGWVRAANHTTSTTVAPSENVSNILYYIIIVSILLFQLSDTYSSGI